MRNAFPRSLLQLPAAVVDYAIDAWQRGILYADIRRQRGNQYREHMRQAVPSVLGFDAEVVLDGRGLPQSVNYRLLRIKSPSRGQADPTKRPFVVVDPRAGHGPGIGGFKPDSEVGAALKAGHPCYFVGFSPEPVPGQTVEDVMRAEAAFVRRVGELHPQAWGKPAVIGNCQAGWQVLMTAAVWPELFGPIIVAGAPVSYWNGANPMRYLGGLMGGSWATALTSDLGRGRFDGAWLVQNFENLNPANTLWSKQYKVYSEVDTEGPRYLGFEKYWGGHVFLDAHEIQYIVDKLFIGNLLSTARLRTSDGVRIDLRNIRSPIVVFCSWGDNITPPPQALGWITDLYEDDEDIAASDQTIVYATHDSIGHLGIFVSGSVGRREHRGFTANIDLIDLLPAGIYRAEVEQCPEGVSTQDLLDGKYLMTVRGSNLDEVRDIVQPDEALNRRFAAAARVSEINLALYRNTLQPGVRALATPGLSRALEAWQPVRLGFEYWSDAHPLASTVRRMAQEVRADRRPVGSDNPLWQWQSLWSDSVVAGLDTWRSLRDAWQAASFRAIYDSPLVQALAGQSVLDREPVREHAGQSPEHRLYRRQALQALEDSSANGGLYEAVLRGLFHIAQGRGEADGRHFRRVWSLLCERVGDERPAQEEFRRLVRAQALLAWRQPEQAIDAIPHLLEAVSPEDIRWGLSVIDELAARATALTDEERARHKRVSGLFQQALSAKVEKHPVPALPRATASKTRSATPPKRRVAAARRPKASSGAGASPKRGARPASSPSTKGS